MRWKKEPDNSLQLSLWSGEQSQGMARQEVQAPVESYGEQVPSSELDLTLFSRETLIFHGPHDDARREWLRVWAGEHGYKKFHFTLHGRYSGYFQSGVAEGRDGWESFLANAVQFDIYCCYISACAPQPLSFYLEDAVTRGEMPTWELNDELLWKPGRLRAKR